MTKQMQNMPEILHVDIFHYMHSGCFTKELTYFSD